MPAKDINEDLGSICWEVAGDRLQDRDLSRKLGAALTKAGYTIEPLGPPETQMGKHAHAMVEAAFERACLTDRKAAESLRPAMLSILEAALRARPQPILRGAEPRMGTATVAIVPDLPMIQVGKFVSPQEGAYLQNAITSVPRGPNEEVQVRVSRGDHFPGFSRREAMEQAGGVRERIARNLAGGGDGAARKLPEPVPALMIDISVRSPAPEALFERMMVKLRETVAEARIRVDVPYREYEKSDGAISVVKDTHRPQGPQVQEFAGP